MSHDYYYDEPFKCDIHNEWNCPYCTDKMCELCGEHLVNGECPTMAG